MSASKRVKLDDAGDVVSIQVTSPKALSWSEKGSPAAFSEASEIDMNSRKRKKLRKKQEKENGTPNSSAPDFVSQSGTEQSSGVPTPQAHIDDTYPAFKVTSRKIVRQIGIPELRELVLYILADEVAPQWLLIRNKYNIKKVVVLLVPGLEPSLFDMKVTSRNQCTQPVSLTSKNIPPPLSVLPSIFSHVFPAKAPGERDKLYSSISSFLNVPITSKEKHLRHVARFAAMKSRQPDSPMEFLLDAEQIRESEYPLHSSLGGGEIPEGWFEISRDLHSKPDEGRTNVVALDCEMCRTEDGSELTRVSIINWEGRVIFDELVKPDKTILDYLTQYSGITAARLANVTTTLKDIQTKMQSLLDSNTTLLGHSLESDFTALKLRHPLVIDTSIIYDHSRGKPWRPSLKWLTHKFLKREIQLSASGHDSIEDAKACMDLLKEKVKHGPLFGAVENQTEHMYERIERANPSRKSAHVDYANLGHGKSASLQSVCQDDDEIIEGIKNALQTCDFVWSRLRCVEKGLGWSTRIDVNDTLPEPPSDVGQLLAQLNHRIQTLWTSLPAATALIIYSGSGDPREMSRLQAKRQLFKKEYETKNWQFIEDKFTDSDKQALEQAVEKARSGVAFLAVK